MTNKEDGLVLEVQSSKDCIVDENCGTSEKSDKF